MISVAFLGPNSGFAEVSAFGLWVTAITLAYMLVLFILGWINFDQRKVTEKEFQAERARLENLVSERTKQLQEKNATLENKIEEIGRLQRTMIDHERLASLGRLSAGIAHEIKNPINLIVNSAKIISNFCNDDFESYLLKITREPTPQMLDFFREDIADVKVACELIKQNGERADFIVKSMLNQVRSGTGVKELFDLSQIIDESLEFVTRSTRAVSPLELKVVKNIAKIPKISMVKQDLARVLVNIFENAFYAMVEKKRNSSLDSQSNMYNPELLIQVEKDQLGVRISIRDNGIGIASDDLQKVFEPFFTTKAAREGTGLGLSMAHDIVSHEKGEIKIESIFGSFTEVSILLPLFFEVENVAKS